MECTPEKDHTIDWLKYCVNKDNKKNEINNCMLEKDHIMDWLKHC